MNSRFGNLDSHTHDSALAALDSRLATLDLLLLTYYS